MAAHIEAAEARVVELRVVLAVRDAERDALQARVAELSEWIRVQTWKPLTVVDGNSELDAARKLVNLWQAQWRDVLDERDALEARVAELEKALKVISTLGPTQDKIDGCPKGIKFEDWDAGYCDGLVAAGIAARAALAWKGRLT